MDPPEARELATYVDARLREKLSRSFELVDAPADDVPRIRFMVVDAEPTKKAQVVGDPPVARRSPAPAPKHRATACGNLGA